MNRIPRWLSHHDVLCLPAILLLVACSGAQPALRDSSWAEPRSTRAFDAVYASGGTRDCDAEQIVCFRKCWKAEPPWPIEKGDKGHDKYCTRKCREEYMECVKELDARPHPLAFPDMKAARDWLANHKTEVLVGTIVVVAGATFVVATGGAGALVLVPLAAL